MFNEYLKKILPIPITKIEVNNDGYKYRITTYSSVLNERGTENSIRKRINNNKRIKSFSGWYSDQQLTTLIDETHVPTNYETYYAKYAIICFNFSLFFPFPINNFR